MGKKIGFVEAFSIGVGGIVGVVLFTYLYYKIEKHQLAKFMDKDLANGNN